MTAISYNTNYSHHLFCLNNADSMSWKHDVEFNLQNLFFFSSPPTPINKAYAFNTRGTLISNEEPGNATIWGKACRVWGQCSQSFLLLPFTYNNCIRNTTGTALFYLLRTTITSLQATRENGSLRPQTTQTPCN